MDRTKEGEIMRIWNFSNNLGRKTRVVYREICDDVLITFYYDGVEERQTWLTRKQFLLIAKELKKLKKEEKKKGK